MTPWRCPGRFSQDISLNKDWAFLGGKTDALDHSSGYQKVDDKFLETPSHKQYDLQQFKSTWHSPYILIILVYAYCLMASVPSILTVRYKYLDNLNIFAIDSYEYLIEIFSW